MSGDLFVRTLAGVIDLKNGVDQIIEKVREWGETTRIVGNRFEDANGIVWRYVRESEKVSYWLNETLARFDEFEIQKQIQANREFNDSLKKTNDSLNETKEQAQQAAQVLNAVQSLSLANRISMEQFMQQAAAATAQAEILQEKMSGLSGGLKVVPGMATMGVLDDQASSGGMRGVAVGDFTDAMAQIEKAQRTSRAGA